MPPDFFGLIPVF